MSTATIISYPTNTINKTIVLSDTLNSFELIQYLWIDTSEAAATDERIEIVYNGETIILYLIDECRYTPIDIVFVNKAGAEQIITFFKKQVDSINVTDEMFESDRGQPTEGNHQFVRYNVNSKSKFTANTGFMPESNNETIRQLLLSEKVWRYNDPTFTPLNVLTKSEEFKTRANDRLINYELEFEFGFNDINNV